MCIHHGIDQGRSIPASALPSRYCLIPHFPYHAGYFTARKTNRDDDLESAGDSRAAFLTARSGGNVSEVESETARGAPSSRSRHQLVTAREGDESGFDTDYMSAFEPGTSRTSGIFEAREQALRRNNRGHAWTRRNEC